MVILGKTKVQDALKVYPRLKPILVQMSPAFNKLNNPLFFKTVARWATFNDVAKMGKIAICQILHTLNKEIGTEAELLHQFPNCIDEITLAHEHHTDSSPEQFHTIIPFDTRTREDYFLPDLVEQIKKLKKGEALKNISTFDPVPLKKMIESMGYSFFTKEIQAELYETYIFSKGAQPEPKNTLSKDGKIPVVIQSATPVTYPIILRLLESEAIRQTFEINELKVWKETEKHLGWIVNDKADISFSALMSSAKMFNKGKDIRMPAMVVWDNFKVLTRGYKAHSFADLKGHKIYTPLFKNAPPAAVTHYLMKKTGYNPDDFEFVFGEPFGRPEEMKACFVSGNCDTVILREPEASFALYEAGDNAHASIDFGALWSELHPGSGNLPNAGLLFSGSFVKKYPQQANLFMEELKLATEWVQENPDRAGEHSAKAMGVSADEVSFFLNRAALEYKKSSDVQNELQLYLEVLKEEDVLKTENIRRIFGLFKW